MNSIVKDMLFDLDLIQRKKVLIILDRSQLIKTLQKVALQSGDIIFTKGKGHEKYQEINGEKLPFDDVKELIESLNISTKNVI